MSETFKPKTILVLAAVGFFALAVFGLLWFFFLGPQTPVGLGWYLFSFAAGLTMIVLPCTLPLAFVIVPLSLGKGAKKGLGIALAFGLGVAITLSMYGVIAAIVGEVFIGTFAAPLETVKNWLYFIAGAFAYLFALGEIGLVRFRMPSYTGAAPAFIQKQGDYLKALLLGLFLGNIGVGCPHPATPVILTRIAASGDVFYGWLLFFVHAIGRILPLLLLAILAILGVNALSWLMARREKVERATGWGMVFVAGFILVLGLFSHDWWVYSGQHTLLEEITQEERFLGVIVERFNLAEPPHTHGIPTGTGLFGLPFWLGNWILVALVVLPMWWHYGRKLKVKREKLKVGGDANVEEIGETRVLPYQFWLYATLTALLALTFIWVLPDRFLNHGAGGELMMHQEEMTAMHSGDEHAVRYHEEGEVKSGLVVSLNVVPAPVLAGQAVRFDFFVSEKPGNIPVPASRLELDHERLMHVIGIRNDLQGFFHIHPHSTSTPGIFTISGILNQPGVYKLWSEIRKDGVNHAFGHPEFAVEGAGERSRKEVFFGRSVIVGGYQVLLHYDEPAAKGRPTALHFEIHGALGREAALEPYLAADIHLTIIRDDWGQFIHTHPAGHAGREPADGIAFIPAARANGVHPEPGGAVHGVPFSVVFPAGGTYKLFVQFRPKGIGLPPDEALRAEFWVEVPEQSGLALSNWWVNLFASLALIALLSWGVKKYLTPHE